MARWIEFDEIIHAPYGFYEADRIRLKEKLSQVEKQIKDIRKRNLISEFKLVYPLRNTARWMNGVLTIMNRNTPPIRLVNSFYATNGIGGYYGAWEIRGEIRAFLQGRNIPKGSKTVSISIAQMVGSRWYGNQ